MNIKEVNIVPIKPTDGLVAFASVVIDGGLYLGSIGIHRRPDGSFRITYPTKRIGDRELNIYHPISREVGALIEQAIMQRCQDVFEGSGDVNGRHRKATDSNTKSPAV